MTPRVGQTICGHIDVRSQLRSGMGSASFGPGMLGHDVETNVEVWLTFVDTPYLPTSIEISQFMAGANALSSLRHPSLVRVAVVDREAEYCVVGYEVLPEARSVATLLDRGERGARQAVVRCAFEIARAMAYLHRQHLVHGCLSTHTVLEWEGSWSLWQYGLAQHCNPAALAQRARRFTDELLAPEALRGQPRTAAQDVYGWATVLAQLCCGVRGQEAIRTLVDEIERIDLPRPLLTLIRQVLGNSSSARPQDGMQLLRLLESSGVREASGAMPIASASSGDPRGQDLPEALASGEYQLVTPLPPKPAPVTKSAGAGSSLLSLRNESLAAGATAQARPTASSTRAKLPAASPRSSVSGTLAGASLLASTASEEPDLLQLAGPAPAVEPLAAAPLDLPTTTNIAEAQPELAKPFRPERLPGPHGPHARWMASVVGVVASGLVMLALFDVARARGGVAAIVGLRPDTLQRLAELPGTRETRDAIVNPDATHGSASADSNTPLDAGAVGTTVSFQANGEDSQPLEPLEPLEPVAPAEPVEPTCPLGMAPNGPRACIDVAEYPGIGRVPTTDITLRDAADACAQRGAQLCSVEQWQRACGGRTRRDYPYGPTYIRDRCNTASIAGFPSEMALTGAYQACASESGVHDLVGNVGEWVAEGIAMGGDSTTEGKVASCTAQGRPPPGFRGPHLGFRCCVDLR